MATYFDNPAIYVLKLAVSDNPNQINAVYL